MKTKNSLENIITSRFNKDEIIPLINSNPEKFKEALTIAFENDKPTAWRAVWLISHAIKKNDKRITPHIKKIISLIPHKADGHQRELLKILEKMEISEDNEGYLYDICVSNWLDINKSSSVRITAFRIISRMVIKYPELYNEIEPLTQKHFTDPLSSGIQHSFSKLHSEIKKCHQNSESI